MVSTAASDWSTPNGAVASRKYASVTRPSRLTVCRRTSAALILGRVPC